MKVVIGLAGGVGFALYGNQSQDCDWQRSEKRRRPHPWFRGSATANGHPLGEGDA
jgi:hypothetical protein